MANKTIGQLNSKTTPASADVFVLEDTEDTKNINYDALADAILNKITSKNYTVAGSSQTLINAINTLNSKTFPRLTISDVYSDTITITNDHSVKTNNGYTVNVLMQITSSFSAGERNIGSFSITPDGTYITGVIVSNDNTELLGAFNVTGSGVLYVNFTNGASANQNVRLVATSLLD